MRSFLMALAASLTMQFAQADTFISRTSGILYDHGHLYGSGTGPYTLEVRSEFDPANMLDTNNPSVVYIRNAVFDFTITHNNFSQSFSSPGSLQLRILDSPTGRRFEQSMFYNNGEFYITQIFGIDSSVFPESRPLQPSAAEGTASNASIGFVDIIRFQMFGNEVMGINGMAWTTYMDSYSFQVITSVPEPHRYAMLAAGLGLLGCAARRKRLPHSRSQTTLGVSQSG